ncbi:MAG: acyl-CoA dehydrogenase [Firmicutes bacterium HGW-Firmicutes-12]|jgi:butyryl-CoA dehydrogenase|nr:MAG: acyl-CoA dehydrogenase [Firmicutes bacterium HGW-Firmicutes-12]
MNFSPTKEQLMVRKMIKQFAHNEMKPIAQLTDEEARYPQETIDKLGKLGVMGMPMPKEYGGAESDYVAYAGAIEELSKVCSSTGLIVQTHVALCCWPILTFGTQEQKRKYLPDLVAGRKLGAFALTEANAGTDAAGLQTKAVDMGDHWVLNGTKAFLSAAGIADVYIVMAMTDKSKGTKGISAFIIEKGTPGFNRGKKEDKMGIRGSLMAEQIIKDCIIPKENLLGEVGKGFKVAMASLDVGRLGVACQALGIAQGAFDETVKYMKSRKQFGKSLDKFQALAFEMADMKTRLDCTRLLILNAADRRDKGLPCTTETAEAKLYASETAVYVTNKAVQFHGGYGYTKDYPVERMMRDAKITEIYEGTSEVMRMVISGDIFR